VLGFKKTFSDSQVTEDLMKGKFFIQYGRKRPWPNFRHCVGLWLEGQTKTSEVYQDNWTPRRNIIIAPCEYETGLLPVGLRLSLNRIIIYL
jgi:hypothetical protein